MKDQITKLKKEKNAVILAHYYVDGTVQEIADYVGDSYYLAEVATKVQESTIIFCGVSFMGESAKILNPGKRVVMADQYADCPMAHMAAIDKIHEVREQYKDVAVVCYVNSTAEIKTASDVCVTSSNAVNIVKNLPNHDIYFIPDENLAHHVAGKVPEKHFIFNDGFCHVHKSIEASEVKKAKEAYTNALVLVHPECTKDVLELADYIGSTSQIIEYATKSDAKEFIIGTEMGIFYELLLKNPDKKFYPVNPKQICPNMKRISIESVLNALKTLSPEVVLDEEVRIKAYEPLKRMLDLAK